MDTERLKDLGKHTQERANEEPKELEQASVTREVAKAEFNAALETICTVLLPRAEKLAEGSGRTSISCLSSILRKELVNHCGPGENGRDPAGDNRERKWLVKIWFWDVTNGEEMRELIAENEEEVMQGLSAIGKAVREYAQGVHEEDGYDALELPEFSALSMLKRMGGMYPAISKGGGSATLRVRYELGAGKYYICQTDISRA